MAQCRLRDDGAGVAVAETCALMAARVRQIGRDQRKVTANAARRGLRQAVKVAESDFSKLSTLGRKLWGGAFWRGQRHTQKSLGIRRNYQGVLTGDAKKLRLYSASRDSARKQYQRTVGKGGSGVPLIVSLTKSRWQGDTWRGGAYARGVAGNLEQGEPFRPHRQGKGQHPGGRVPRRPALEPAVRQQAGAIGTAVRQDVERFMAVNLG